MGIQKRHGEVLVFALFYVLFVVIAEVWAITTQLFPVSGKGRGEGKRWNSENGSENDELHNKDFKSSVA